MNENFTILYEELEKIFIQYSLKEITEKLRFSEVTFGVLSHSNDHSKDQQFIESEVLVKFDKGSFDEDFFTVNSPIFLENESKKIPTKAPKLGEHTKEILSSLGQDEEEIAQLKQDGIIDY